MWQIGFDKDYALKILTRIEIEEVVISARITVLAAVDAALVRIKAPLKRHSLDPINGATGLNFFVIYASQ